MKKIVSLLVLFVLCNIDAIVGQTYSYKYLHSIKDEIKIQLILPKKNSVFYFTFTNNKKNCYLTDKNGVYDGGYGENTYKYIGKKNGILIYQECNQNIFRYGQDLLYFSPDFKRMNWRCFSDDHTINPNEAGSIRVLERVLNPNSVDVPSTLY